MADDLDAVRATMNTHLFECAQNYAELHAITEVQNAKIDALTKTVSTLTTVIISSVGFAFATVVTVAGYLAKLYLSQA
ncbi:hypothetical protein [Burkholderia guangdongensis]|uniref:hypothetical protein n=1 Tax=Burkholderia guangdongensis TaxID=1792500 RepID=UPI0015CAD2A4|nr:hypothetical protein [Burkholderia guangdongensis]